MDKKATNLEVDDVETRCGRAGDLLDPELAGICELARWDDGIEDVVSLLCALLLCCVQLDGYIKAKGKCLIKAMKDELSANTLLVGEGTGPAAAAVDAAIWAALIRAWSKPEFEHQFR